MKKNKMVTMRIIALLLLLVGLAVTTASTYLVISHAVKSKSYTDNVAIVVEHKSKKNGLKAIVIEYNIDNKYYRVESKHYTKKPESIGDPIKIKYNSKNHEDFIWIDNNHNHKYLISGLILLGGDILIWIILNITGKKKVDVSTPEEEKIEPPKNEETKAEEPKVEEQKVDEPKVEEPNNVELPEVKSEEPVVEEPKQETQPVLEDNAPLFEKEEVPAIFTPLTEEEKQNLEIEKEKEEKVELPVIEEEKIDLPVIEEPKEEPVIKEEVQKINIPEIPYDLDSPREAIVSNVMETTIAIPTLNKELIELPTKKEEKNVKINNDIKSDALTKLLEDLEKEKK